MLHRQDGRRHHLALGALGLHVLVVPRSQRPGCSGYSLERSNAPRQPNLLLAMADQLRWDAQGYSWVGSRAPKALHTPNLDRLAAEGVVFDYAVSSTPTCTPARAALLTGRRPWGHGLLGYGEIARRYPLAFPRILRDAGYLCVAIGKDHFGWNSTSGRGVSHGYEITHVYDGLGDFRPSWNTSHRWAGEFDDYDAWFENQTSGLDPMATLDDPAKGFDAWNGWRGRPYAYPEHLHPTAWVGARAEAFLRSNRSSDGRPWFLKVSWHRPHSPYDPPERLLDQVQEADLPPVALCELAAQMEVGRAARVYAGAYKGSAWCLRYRGNLSLGDPQGCGSASWANFSLGGPNDWCGGRRCDASMWCGEAVPKAEEVLGRRAYLASVTFVDEQVGRVLTALTETGQLERTLVLWVSDHGDAQGDHYHWRKGFPYEFSVRVPMVLRWPDPNLELLPSAVRLKRGSVVRAPIVVELRDVAHTFLDAAGAARDEALVPPFGRGAHGQAFEAADGRSLLCLLADPTGTCPCAYPPNPGRWRPYIDLEHAKMYNETNHWNALTDGRTKYVFTAFDGTEQLFDLLSDPRETRDLAPNPMYATVLATWRTRLVQQFEAEGRGPLWVVNGTLALRTQKTTYGPNYPQQPPPPPHPPLAPQPARPQDAGAWPGATPAPALPQASVER